MVSGRGVLDFCNISGDGLKVRSLRGNGGGSKYFLW